MRSSKGVSLPMAASTDIDPATTAAANRLRVANRPRSASAVETWVPFRSARPSLGPRRSGESRHLFCGGHPRHAGVRRMIHACHDVPMAGRWLWFTAFAQPALHEFDLIGLRSVDAAGNLPHGPRVGTISDQCGHLNCLAVVQDHVLHELHVVGGIAIVSDARRLASLKHAAGLAGRARLDDGRLLRRCAARDAKDQDAGGGGAPKHFLKGQAGLAQQNHSLTVVGEAAASRSAQPIGRTMTSTATAAKRVAGSVSQT